MAKKNASGRPVVALCEWFWRLPGTHEWVRDDEIDGPRYAGIFRAAELRCDAACRASLGVRIVTVWLPRGARIRLRFPMRNTWRHTYGRDRDRAIRIRLTELPTP